VDADDPAYAEGLTLKALAELDALSGLFDLAADRYRAARSRLESCREPEHPRTLEVIEALARVCGEQGRQAEADHLDAVLAEHWKLYPLTGTRDHAIRSRSRLYGGRYYLEGIDLILHPLPDRTRLIEATRNPLSSSACHTARWYHARGWYDVAEEVYRFVLESRFGSDRHPIKLEAAGGLAHLLEEAGRRQEAREWADKLRVYGRARWYHHEAKRLGDANRRAKAWLHEAGDLNSVDAWQSALDCVRCALVLEPSDPEICLSAQMLMAELLHSLGRLAESEDTLRRLLMGHPSIASIHYRLGRVVADLDRPLEAARCYLEADRLWNGRSPMVPFRLHELVAEHPRVRREIPEVGARLAKDPNLYFQSERGPIL
jgi:hypothetical protein